MASHSLYAAGWRQGSVVAVELPLTGIGANEDFDPTPWHRVHDLWVVASQDCTLDNSARDAAASIVELRPVRTENPPTYWGLRSTLFLLDAEHYVDDNLPRVHISPLVLYHLGESGRQQVRELDPNRAIAFKTWLGLRYDRPAVPPEYGELAVAVQQAVKQHRDRGIEVRDVLMEFPVTPGEYGLYAIILDEADSAAVREWLAAVSLDVPTRLGTPIRLEVLTSREASLHLIENSYSANVSDITWRKSGPRGAY